VGPGTFRPVTTPDIAQHRLDAERYEVSEAAAQSLRQAQAQGRPIVAVGTTVVRTLETWPGWVPWLPAAGRPACFLCQGPSFAW